MVRVTPSLRRAPFLLSLLLLAAACGQKLPEGREPPSRAAASPATLPAVDPARLQLAVAQSSELRAKGQRVWCVPFARTASGIDILGNAKTWWEQAKGLYPRGHEPQGGAVMAFQPTGKIPLGHVAVVSEVVSPREILVDHANWEKNEVSLRMAVVDVSKANDWSAVRLESQPGTLGRVYPVKGFIYPKRDG